MEAAVPMLKKNNPGIISASWNLENSDSPDMIGKSA
jgi:hypothetical protein